jgi:TP901 family phage tail tape measure protein
VSEGLPIELDGSGVQKGAEVAVNSLRELRAAIENFGRLPVDQIKSNMTAALAPIMEAVNLLDADFKGMAAAFLAATRQMAGDGKAAGAKIGAEMGGALLGETEKAVVKARASINGLSKDGAKIVISGDYSVIDKIAEKHRELTKEIGVDNLQMLRDAQQSADLTFRMRSNYLKAEIKEKAESEREKAALDKQTAREAQQSSDLTFRMRSNYWKAEVKEKSKAEAELAAIEAATTRANLHAYAQDLNGYQLMQKLRVDAARVAAQQIASANLTAAGSASRALLNNMQVVGDSSSIVRGPRFGTPIVVPDIKSETDATHGLAAAARALDSDTKNLVKSKAELAHQSREVHSAFRGVAAAAGGLFLTYGSLIPLVTAFAAASSVKEAIQTFKDLEYRLQFTRALTQDYTLSLEEMREKLVAVSMVMGVAPVEAAKGMQALAQAGMSASDALRLLPTTLALATIGETDAATAATALTGALHAFNLSVESASRVTDTFAKAAAVSNTTVAGIAESMKQASTIAQEFKISIEDVGTILAALAKRNITGSAAGTATRNMFTEILAPKGAGKEIAARLKLDLFDPITFNVNSFFDSYLPDLRRKLAEYNAKSQETILHGLFNERGAKAMQALLGMTPEDLAQLRADVTDNAGYAMKVFIEANNTIQGELNRLKATFAASLAEGGSGVAEELKSALQSVREAVGSPEFQSTLRGMLKILVDLLGVVGSIGSVLFSPGGAIAALTALGTASVLFRNGALIATPAAHGLAASLAGVQLGAAGAGFALTGLAATFASLARFTLVTAAIVGVVMALSKLYDVLNTPTPTQKLEAEYKTLADGSKQYVEQLQKEINAIKEKRALQTGEFGAIAEVVKSNELIADSSNRLAAAQILLNRPENTREFNRVQRQRVNALLEENLALKANGDATQARLKKARELAEEIRRLQEESNPKAQIATGSKNWVTPDTQAANTIAQELKRAQTLAQQEADLRLRIATDAENQEERLLKRSYEQRLISYGEYEAKLEAMAQRNALSRMDRMRSDLETAQENLRKLTAARDSARAAGGKNTPVTVENDIREAALAVAKEQLKIDQAITAEANRKGDALTKALAPSQALVEAGQKELASLNTNAEQELKKLEAKSNLNKLTEREVFLQEQLLRLANGYEDSISKLQQGMVQQLMTGVYDDLTDPAKQKQYQTLLDTITNLQAALASLNGTAPARILNVYDGNKAQELRKREAQEYEKLALHINDTLVDAIMDAGRDGGAGLRKFIEDELVRKPFKLFLQAVISPFSNAIAGFINPAGAAASAAGAGGSALNMLGNGTSVYSGLGGMGANFMAGYSGAVSLGTGGVGASFGVVDAMGGAAATGGVGAGISTMLSAIPVWGWAAMAAVAVASIFGGGGGGPKTESGYTPFKGLDTYAGFDGTEYERDTAGARAISDAISGSYAALAKTLGIKDGVLDVSVFYAMDNAEGGTAQTILQVASSSYNRGNRLGGVENVARGDDALKKEIADETIRVLYAGLLDSDLAEKFKSYLRQFDISGDAAVLNSAISLVTSAKEMYTIFDGIGDSMADLSAMSLDTVKALAEAAGGFDQLKAGLASYYDNFYSDEEKRLNTARAISAKLKEVGFGFSAEDIEEFTRTNPDAKKLFRELAEAQDLTTESGRAAYAALIMVSGAFASLVPSVQAVADAASTANSQILSDVETAAAALRRARQAEADSLRTTIASLTSAAERLRNFAKDIRSFRDSLLLGDLSPLTPAQKYEAAKNKFEATYAAAMGGDQEAMAQLQSVSNEFLQASQVYNASGAMYQADFARVQAALTLSATSAVAQANAAETQAELLQAQLDKLDTVNDSVLTVAQAIDKLGAAIAAALGAGLNPTAASLALLTGGVTGQFVSTPGGEIYTSTAGASATGGVIYSPNGAVTTGTFFAQELERLRAEDRWRDAYYWIKSLGITLAEANMVVPWPAGTAESLSTALGLPIFHQGTNYVPRTGFALLQEGEAVIPRYSNPAAGGGYDGNAAMVSRLESIERTLVELGKAVVESNYDAADRAAEKMVGGTANAKDRKGWDRNLAREAQPA